MESTTSPSSPPSLAAGQPQLPRIDSNASGSDQLSSSPRSSQGSASSTSGKDNDANVPSSDAADPAMLRHPKGKRKRTAAKDKAILESAYLANPKPDKTARLDIVSQVSLNEKEVQIWFQNRRQNDRRKSRPLSAQEIAALRYGGMHALSSDPPLPYGHSHHPTPQQHLPYSDSTVISSPPHHQHFNSAAMATPNSNALSTTPLSSPEMGPWMPDALARKLAEDQQQRQQEFGNHRLAQTPSSAPPSFSNSVGSVGYLANRWNMHSSFSTPSSFNADGNGPREDPAKMDPFVASAAPTATPVLPPLPAQQPPPQQASQRPFRLSMSLEGKAEVISSMSPSPPRLPHPQTLPALDRPNIVSGSDSPVPALPAIRRSGLNRSHSALPSLGLTLPPISSLTSSLSNDSAPPLSAPQPAHPPRLLRGRSRDVHAWESVCDAETRADDELSAQAQHEASGSAIAAISLLRSVSATNPAAISPVTATSVLQTNATKRNTPTRSIGSRPGAKRTKLGRTTSSVARMQSSRDIWGTDEKEKDKAAWVDEEKRKKLKLSTLLSGNDSDKENWSPDEEGNPATHAPRPGLPTTASNAGRRPLPSMRSAGHQQQRSMGRILDNSKTSFKDAASDMLATRHVRGKSLGGALSFKGQDIYEDPSGNGPAKHRRLPLPRAATIAGVDDVERFMRGDQVSPSKRGDLDCVAGLLSLSQGNWR